MMGTLLQLAAAAQLLTALGDIKAAEEKGDYEERNSRIWDAFHCAKVTGCGVGVRIDPKEPEWPVVFIELPTGQVSWHVPQHAAAWDGHDTGEKYRRVDDFINQNELYVQIMGKR